jgi:hypothetical protein
MGLFLALSIYSAQAFNNYDVDEELRKKTQQERLEREANEPAPTLEGPGASMPMQQQPPPPPPPPMQQSAPLWTQLYDPNTQRPYWMNNATQQTTWEPPPGFAPAYPPASHPMAPPEQA